MNKKICAKTIVSILCVLLFIPCLSKAGEGDLEDTEDLFELSIERLMGDTDSNRIASGAVDI